jgi:hypothetical protein
MNAVRRTGGITSMASLNLVTIEEVGRACKSLGIRDWSNAPTFTVAEDEARGILKKVGGEAEEVGLEDFREGLQVELEHGGDVLAGGLYLP